MLWRQKNCQQKQKLFQFIDFILHSMVIMFKMYFLLHLPTVSNVMPLKELPTRTKPIADSIIERFLDFILHFMVILFKMYFVWLVLPMPSDVMSLKELPTTKISARYVLARLFNKSFHILVLGAVNVCLKSVHFKPPYLLLTTMARPLKIRPLHDRFNKNNQTRRYLSKLFS